MPISDPAKMRTSLAYTVLMRDHLRNTVPAATCIRPSSGRYRSISSETPTTALSLERSCAARTRRFLSAAIPFIDSLSTQSATTPPSSLSGEERNIRLFGCADLGARPPTAGSLRWAGCEDEQRSTTGPTPQSTGTGTVRQAQGTSPHHRKVLYFPAKSWFRCERHGLSPSALTPTNTPTHSRSFLFLHSHGGLGKLRA
jgi:hypothetical protein